MTSESPKYSILLSEEVFMPAADDVTDDDVGVSLVLVLLLLLLPLLLLLSFVVFVAVTVFSLCMIMRNPITRFSKVSRDFFGLNSHTTRQDG
jgi:hypothetical protein